MAHTSYNEATSIRAFLERRLYKKLGIKSHIFITYDLFSLGTVIRLDFENIPPISIKLPTDYNELLSVKELLNNNSSILDYIIDRLHQSNPELFI